MLDFTYFFGLRLHLMVSEQPVSITETVSSVTEITSEQNHKLVMLAMTTTSRFSVSQSTQLDQNDGYGNQGGTLLHQERVGANTHTHTQGCLKMYLDAVHNKLLLVVSFKIYSFQIQGYS